MTLYSIKETSQRKGHTIRHYCDLGLFPSLQRDINNNSLFDEVAIHTLFTLKFL